MAKVDTVANIAATIYAARVAKAQKPYSQIDADLLAVEAWAIFYGVSRMAAPVARRLADRDPSPF
jgi:hypothetical protein